MPPRSSGPTPPPMRCSSFWPRPATAASTRATAERGGQLPDRLDQVEICRSERIRSAKQSDAVHAVISVGLRGDLYLRQQTGGWVVPGSVGMHLLGDVHNSS